MSSSVAVQDAPVLTDKSFNPRRHEEALQYYSVRVQKMDEVIKLRPGTAAAPDDLHAIVGYDYLSLAQWDATLDIILGSRVKLPPNARVLEAGCGAGAVLDYLCRHNPGGLEAYAVDLTPGLLEVAKRRVPTPTYWQGDICEEQTFAHLPEKSFDLVYSFGVFIHLNSHEHAKRALRNMYRLVKPGGTLFIGYNLDAYNEKEVEQSRSSSQRRVEFEKLLGVVPSYLFCGYKFYLEFAEETGAHIETAVMKEQIENNHPLLSPLPRSFLGRCSVYFTRPAESL